MERQNNFQTVAATAEEKLGKVSVAMEESLARLPVEKIEAAKEELIREKVDDFLVILGSDIYEWSTMGWNLTNEGMKTKFLPSSEGFVPELGEAFIKSVLTDEKWLNYYRQSSSDSIMSLFVFLSMIGEQYEKRENERKEETGDTDPVTPLVFHFKESDFSTPPPYFGTIFSKHLSLIIDGGVREYLGIGMRGGMITVLGEAENYVGDEMTGGTICVHGNTRHYTGRGMKNGEIEVLKNSGNFTGKFMRGGKIIINDGSGKLTSDGMVGGTLDIRGDVLSFAKSAFSEDNKGTIIWKGITIWRDGGWTREGRAVNERGEIPIA